MNNLEGMTPERLFGLVGHPLGHSFSQRFFREKFAREGLSADYLNFDIDDIRQLPDIISAYPQLCGLNVTVPYKQAVIPFLDEIDGPASRIGAVNTIVIDRGGETPRLKGYNTDCIGFGDSLDTFSHRRIAAALILGTGGASRAVRAALDQRGIAHVSVSRTPGEDRITYSDLDAEVITAHPLIVNCTPLGTFPDCDSAPDIPYELLDSRHIAMDLVYNPSVTRFMAQCAARGCAVKNGLDMLIGQARAAWRIWNAGI